MNSRGQAFSVFKLLIAAVVAGAILLILLQTLDVLPDIGSQNPNESAANAVKSQINSPSLPQFVDNVTFEKDDSLNARAIAADSRSLDASQICVIISPNVPNFGAFSTGGGTGGATKIIQYNGTFPQEVRLMIMCDDADVLGTAITLDYGYTAIPVSSCSFSGSNTACVVAIVGKDLVT